MFAIRRGGPNSLLTNTTLRRAIGEASRPYRARMVGLGFLIVAGTLVPLGPPLLYRLVIDHLIDNGPFRQALPMVVAAGVLTIVGVLLTYAYTALATSLGRRIIADLQTRMHDTLARKPLEFFTTLRGGAAGARLTTDVYGTEPLFTRVIVALLANLITLIAAVVVLTVIDWRLAPVLLLVFLIFRPVGAKEQRINALIREQNGINTELVVGADSLLTLPGMTLARQSARVDNEVGSFRGAVERLRTRATQLANTGGQITAGFNLAFGLVTSVVFLAGAWLVSQGDMSVGTLVLFLLYIRLVQQPLTALAGLRFEAYRAARAFERVFEVLDSDSAVPRGVRSSRKGVCGRGWPSDTHSGPSVALR